jgi:hypothetical protein
MVNSLDGERGGKKEDLRGAPEELRELENVYPVAGTADEGSRQSRVGWFAVV